jgi:hypothetical protein
MPMLLEDDFKNNQTLKFLLNEQFENNGYNTISSILNLGSLFFYAIGILLINLILVLAGRFPYVNSMRLYQWMSEKVFHSLLLRFLIESYVQIIMSANINFVKIQYSGTMSVTFPSIFSIILVTLALILIIHNCWL